MVSIKKKISSNEIISYVNSISKNKVNNEINNFYISEVRPLNKFQTGALSFAKNLTEESISEIPKIKDGLLIISKDSEKPNCPHIVVENPRYIFGKIVNKFFYIKWLPEDISKEARIHENAFIGKDVSIGRNVTIDQGVIVNERTKICEGTIIGPNVKIGKDCVIKSNTVIGQPGFGTEKGPDGKNFYLPHIGSVIIGNRVWIGALNSIASGTIDPTIIEDDVMTDDQVHIAHNAIIKSNTIIAASTEISGSTIVGKNSRIGPGNSVMNGISIGNETITGIGAAITKSHPDRVVLAGVPARIVNRL